jgi:hypothetical protein
VVFPMAVGVSRTSILQTLRITVASSRSVTGVSLSLSLRQPRSSIAKCPILTRAISRDQHVRCPYLEEILNTEVEILVVISIA